MIDTVVKYILGIVKLRGGTDGTIIGNSSDALKVSATVTSSTLPSGAATSALQTAGNASLASIDSKLTSPISVSGSISASQSGTWNVGVTNGAGGSAVNIQDGGNSITVDGPLTDSQLRASPVPVSGTLTANQGTSPWVTSAAQSGSWTVIANAGTNLNTSALALDTTVSGLQVSQGSTTSGQKGTLSLGAVTIASPSYTTAQTSPLSLTTAGALRTDSSSTTQPVSGTVSVSGSVAVTGPLTDTQLRASPVPVSGTVTANAGTNLNTSALALETTQTAQNTLIGAVTETAPATDTASSGLNGRLQRVAQRLTTINTTLGSPFQAGGSIGNTAFGISGTLPAFAATPTFNIGTISTIATEASLSAQSTLIGAVTETAPATDTASSGLNGRLQRIAQRLTSIIALLPSSLGQKTMTNSFAVTLASDQTSLAVKANTGTVTATSVTATNASAQALASNANRKYLLIQNSGSRPIWIRFTSAATAAAPSLVINAGASFTMEGNFVSTEAVNVIRGGGANVTFTIIEGT